MANYYFRLPTLNELSTSQRMAMEDTNSIALSGGPGTGKSVVSLYRHISNYTKPNKIKSQLLTYTTSLALYLKESTKTQHQEASEYVDSAYHWKNNHTGTRDEIIMDEAQDMPLIYNQNLKSYAEKISYGADNQQLLKSNSILQNGTFDLTVCSPEEALRQEYPTNSPHELSKNYRNTRRILKLAKQLFVNAAIPRQIIDSCNIEGEYPRLLISSNNIQKQDNAIVSIMQQFLTSPDINTAILVPFENQNNPAGATATAGYYSSLLENNNIDHSIYTSIMNGCAEIKNIHITTFKSAKGLEFDNVIIPCFHLVNQTFRVVTWRDFYVGITRAKSNLFILSNIDFPNLISQGDAKVIEKVML